MAYYRRGDWGTTFVETEDLAEWLEAEQRETKPCPFCNGTYIEINCNQTMFYMDCIECGARGPTVWDDDDPAGLNETSWIYALKVCHDKWNGRA